MLINDLNSRVQKKLGFKPANIHTSNIIVCEVLLSIQSVTFTVVTSSLNHGVAVEISTTTLIVIHVAILA